MELDCIVIDDEPHAISELEDLIAIAPGLKLTKSFSDIPQAISFLQANGKVSVIFSDINMPLINGIDSAKTLKRYCDYLIYVTAHRNYALDAFEVNAAAYLVKPVSKILFLEKIDEILNLHLSSHSSGTLDGNLFVRGNAKNSFIKINYSEIIFIEGLLNYVIIHTKNARIITYMGLKEIIKKLEHTHIFLRINKSIIISTNFISHVDGNTVHLMNQQSYAIGRIYKSAFHEYIMKRTLNGE